MSYLTESRHVSLLVEIGLATEHGEHSLLCNVRLDSVEMLWEVD